MASESQFSPGGPPPKSGSNTLLWMLGIGGLCLLLCCGGGVFVAWRLGSVAQDFVANMATSDPQEIRRQTQEMLDIDIPETYKPMQGMNLMAFRMVMYQTSQAEDGASGMLTLMQMTIDQPGVTAEQQEQQLRDSMRQQQANQDFEASKSETREIEIRGEKVPFQFSEGTVDQGGQQQSMHTVSGVVTGTQDRSVMIQITVPDEAYDEQAIVEMLQSIK
jgi:hypothetical protein